MFTAYINSTKLKLNNTKNKKVTMREGMLNLFQSYPVKYVFTNHSTANFTSDQSFSIIVILYDYTDNSDLETSLGINLQYLFDPYFKYENVYDIKVRTLSDFENDLFKDSDEKREIETFYYPIYTSDKLPL